MMTNYGSDLLQDQIGQQIVSTSPRDLRGARGTSLNEKPEHNDNQTTSLGKHESATGQKQMVRWHLSANYLPFTIN